MSSINLQVQGMTCNACVRHVSKALSAITGVSAVEVDLTSGLVRVDGSPDSAELLAALDDAGYPAQVAGPTAAAQAPRTGCGSGCGCR